MKDPAIYFTTDVPAENHLDKLARDWGVARLPDESDAQLRRRMRRSVGTTNRGTLEDLRDAINEVVGVLHVREITVESTDQRRFTVILRVVTTVAHQSLRDQIEAVIELTRAAGSIVELELELPDGQAWA